MPNIKYEDIEKDLAKTQAQAEAVTGKAREIETRLDTVLGAQQLQAIEVDVDDSDFSALHKGSEAFEANIATLIHGLDEVTQAFGAEFKQMSEMTTGEKLIGMFSRRKATEMRTTRVRSTDIRGNLNQLIEKSNKIQALLEGQRAVIVDRLAKTTEGYRKVNERSRITAAEIEALNKELDRLGPEVAEIQGRLDEATGEARKAIEEEMRIKSGAYNEASTQLQSRTGEQQSLERYANQYKNYVDSLTQQKAAQDTLINKLKIDTEQRTVLYDSLAESLKTSQQQDVAHRIDSVGRETDAQAEELMTQVGISAQNKIAGMLEAHEAYMRRTEEVSRKGRIAQDSFQRRFSKVMEKVETGRYTTDAA